MNEQKFRSKFKANVELKLLDFQKLKDSCPNSIVNTYFKSSYISKVT